MNSLKKLFNREEQHVDDRVVYINLLNQDKKKVINDIKSDYSYKGIVKASWSIVTNESEALEDNVLVMSLSVDKENKKDSKKFRDSFISWLKLEYSAVEIETNWSHIQK